MSTGQQPTAESPPAVDSKAVEPMVSSADPDFLSNPTPNDYPRAWYHFAATDELSRGPISKDILGQRFVGFLTASGKPAVLASRCIHMGSDLSSGCVVGVTVRHRVDDLARRRIRHLEPLSAARFDPFPVDEHARTVEPGRQSGRRRRWTICAPGARRPRVGRH